MKRAPKPWNMRIVPALEHIDPMFWRMKPARKIRNMYAHLSVPLLPHEKKPSLIPISMLKIALSL